MRRLVSAGGGTLLFAAALALSLPGVEAVRAEGPPADAPMCRADQPAVTESSLARLAQAVRMQAAAESEAEAAAEGTRFVNLNTRGYNYDTGTVGMDAALVLREARLKGIPDPAPAP